MANILMSYFIFLILFVGCSIPLQPGADKINRISAQQTLECDLLSKNNIVSNPTTGFGDEQFRENVYRRMLNFAAESGGDSILINRHGVYSGDFNVYKCNENLVSPIADELTKFETILKNNILPLKGTIQQSHFIQPINKQIECKITITTDNFDKNKDFKIFWDGDCKNGYATGIGRKYILDTKNKLTTNIGNFEKGESIYCILPEDSNSIYRGECKQDGEGFISNMQEKEFGDFDLSLHTGIINSNKSITVTTSPFSLGTKIYRIIENDLTYEYTDNTLNEFNTVREIFKIYSTQTPKDYIIVFNSKKIRDLFAYKILNNTKPTKIQLSQKELNGILEKIEYMKQKTQINTQIKTDVKKIELSYKEKICNKQKLIKEIDDYDYFSICNTKNEDDMYDKIIQKVSTLKNDAIRKKQELDSHSSQTTKLKTLNTFLNQEEIDSKRKVLFFNNHVNSLPH